MSAEVPAPTLRHHSNVYNIFILVLTIGSLVLMVMLLLPIDDATRQVVTLYDNLICVVFLIDFALNLAGARPTRAYLIGQRGWLDLLGSLPALGIVQFAVLLRLARLSRLARIVRLLGRGERKRLLADILANRGQYAATITILLAGIVLVSASVLILQFESRSPDANIKTGGDALWWGVVTITTVGYGDRYPVTALGRLTGVFVMTTGIGIIGALASILASVLVAPATPETLPEPSVPGTGSDPSVASARAISDELAAIRAEVAALRGALASGPAGGPPPTAAASPAATDGP
jgi:voltage-gated potassium channel